MHNWTVDNRNLKLSLVFVNYFSLQTFSSSSPQDIKFKKIRPCIGNKSHASLWVLGLVWIFFSYVIWEKKSLLQSDEITLISMVLGSDKP